MRSACSKGPDVNGLDGEVFTRPDYLFSLAGELLVVERYLLAGARTVPFSSPNRDRASITA